MNTTGLTEQHLDLGLFGLTTANGSGGFQSMVFTISVAGTTVATESFTSLSTLESFNDYIVYLGALQSSTALAIDFNLAYTSTGGGDSFDGSFVFGNAAAAPPSPAAVPAGGGSAQLSGQPLVIPEPSTWILLAAAAAVLVGVRRRRRIL